MNIAQHHTLIRSPQAARLRVERDRIASLLEHAEQQHAEAVAAAAERAPVAEPVTAAAVERARLEDLVDDGQRRVELEARRVADEKALAAWKARVEAAHKKADEAGAAIAFYKSSLTEAELLTIGAVADAAQGELAACQSRYFQAVQACRSAAIELAGLFAVAWAADRARNRAGTDLAGLSPIEVPALAMTVPGLWTVSVGGARFRECDTPHMSVDLGDLGRDADAFARAIFEAATEEAGA